MTADVYQFWNDALAGKSPAIDVNTPQCGFYKMREAKGGKWLPVMIRFDGAELKCRVGNDSGVDPHRVWTYCAGKPVSKADAKVAFETGSFPGEIEDLGDNSKDLSLAEQISDYAERALSWLKKFGITDTKSKDMAANYRAELLRLNKEADAQRRAEKKPHDEASAAVQAKWLPLIDAATEAAEMLRDRLTVYMREEERKAQAERDAKYEAERRAIESARKSAEEQRAKMERDDPVAFLTGAAPELPEIELPPPPEAVKIQAGGQRGRKTGLREVTTYVVTNYEAALGHAKDHPDVVAAVQKVCAAQARAGATVPGVEKKIEKVAA